MNRWEKGEKEEENRRGEGDGAAGGKVAMAQAEKAEELDQKGRQEWEEKWGRGKGEGERQEEETPTSRKEWTATQSQAPRGQWPLAWFTWLGDDCSSSGGRTHLYTQDNHGPGIMRQRARVLACAPAVGGTRMSGPQAADINGTAPLIHP